MISNTLFGHFIYSVAIDRDNSGHWSCQW